MPRSGNEIGDGPEELAEILSDAGRRILVDAHWRTYAAQTAMAVGDGGSSGDDDEGTVDGQQSAGTDSGEYTVYTSSSSLGLPLAWWLCMTFSMPLLCFFG